MSEEHEDQEKQPRRPYRVRFTLDCEPTLRWLHDRGYDGAFLALAHRSYTPDGRLEYSLAEHEAWQFKEEVDADPDAFLACLNTRVPIGAMIENGLQGLLNQIV